jgi:hypothetical protein
MRTLCSSRDWAARLSVLFLMAAGLAGPVLHPALHGALEGTAHHETGHDSDGPAPAEVPDGEHDCALCVASAALTAPRVGAPIPAYLLEGVQEPPAPAPRGPELNRALPPRAPPVG